MTSSEFPQNWAVRVCVENKKELEEWRDASIYDPYGYMTSKKLHRDGRGGYWVESLRDVPGFTEISYEDWQKYVLRKEPFDNIVNNSYDIF